MIKELVKESLIIVVSLSLVTTLLVINPLSAEDSNITNTTTTTSTVTSNNTNTNNFCCNKHC